MQAGAPMKSVLITGGTGSLGYGLVERLLKTDIERICVMARGEHRLADMEQKFDDPRVRTFVGDVRDSDRVHRAMDGIDVVVHAAALKRIETGYRDPEEVTKTNVGGSANIIRVAKATRVQKVVLVSTDKAVEPISPYGYSKATAEQLFRTATDQRRGGPIFSIVRYGNVWKSAGSVVPLWQSILRATNTVPVTDPECTRYFMWLHEAVSFVLQTVEVMRGGETRIPELPAYRLGDLAVAMVAEQKVIGLSRYEKLHEKMRDGPETSEHARRMTIDELRAAL